MTTQPRTRKTHRNGARAQLRTRSALVALEPATAASLEAELVHGTDAPSFAAAAADALIDSYLDEHGRLVPAPSEALLHLPPELTEEQRQRRIERSRFVDMIRADAWADSTLTAYGWHVRAWRAWAGEEGVPALPLNPLDVAHHLVDYAFRWTGDQPELDEDGEPCPAVAASTISQRIAALNKLAEFVGIPRPGDNEGVGQLVLGLRRRLLVAPENAKAALDRRSLDRCLAATTGVQLAAARLQVMVLLRHAAGCTAGQLARLHWADVAFADDGSWADVTFTGSRRHDPGRSIRLHRRAGAETCAVRALEDLYRISPGRGWVLAHGSGRALTRQAIHLAVTTAVAASWDEVPRLPLVELRRAIPTATSCGAFMAARDAALLEVGFITALRRSNLSALNWRDVVDHGCDGFELRIRRSKTDQEGHGRSKWVPQAEPGSTGPCPASAFRRYRAELVKSLSREPKGEEPVFCAALSNGALRRDRQGRPCRLTGDGVNEVVQRLATAAGLATTTVNGRHPYGAHSLRAGFITEALRDNKLAIEDVQEVSDHRTIAILLDYRREVNASQRNGSRKMVQALGSSSGKA